MQQQLTEKKQIQKIRTKYLLKIRSCEKKGKDARPLLDEFYRLNNEFIKLGGRPEALTGALTREYWEDLIDHKAQPKHVDSSISRPVAATEKNYYILNITWERNIDTNLIKKYFDLLYLQKHDFQRDKMSYIYKGNNEGFKMLKRSTQAWLDIMFPNESPNVYGSSMLKM